MDESKTSWTGEKAGVGAMPGRFFSRLTSLALELLESRGGFQFTYICLGLMSVSVGLTFQRAIQDITHGSANAPVAGAFVQDSFVVILWFWAFMAASTVAGAVFLRLFRDEIRQRQAREVAERRADFLAFNDPVTGLANGTFFQDRLSDLTVADTRFGLIMLSIDGFRELTERFGRRSGDVVLKEVAHRLGAQAEAMEGFAARLSSDKFALVIFESDAVRLKEFAEDILFACSEPVVRAAQTFFPQVSVGCVPVEVVGPRRPGPEFLISAAEFALEVTAKRSETRLAIFDEELAARYAGHRVVVERLPGAISNGELQVFFQPQIDLATGEIDGFEALVRWSCDGRFIPTPELIHAAEQNGLITDLDRFMLSEAAQIVSKWNRTHRKRLAVSSNLSAVNLTNEDTVGFVASVLERSALLPELLTVEITESVELENDPRVQSIVGQLRALGCRVSIDDFGAGYSTFRYLRDIRVDEIKIDRSLVMDIEESPAARHILESVIRMSEQLGRSTVVEGVETEGQADLIRSFGGRTAQGFFYGKPRPALDWLADTTYRPRSETHPAPAA